MKDKIIGWVLVVLGALWGLASIFGVWASRGEYIYLPLQVVGLLLSVIHIICGLGLINEKTWAGLSSFILSIVFTSLSLWLTVGFRTINNEYLRVIGGFLSYSGIGFILLIVYFAIFLTKLISIVSKKQ